ncbi:hypothetical protein LP316_09470 [Thalassotalea sp. LPB0316]|uniref:MaoC/PaaZ C-terminal domain-containing protein n=1 Tax=Thalassotalea sp. LPB0316 TaxID=2769490 RepID=UPI0018675DD9|nr:MaoC/PaaZ C-terminal domain-containing protein [Thalassotalea sp. LPB0316]QOL24583.1 hypothetical protein LP316_09470 [Thalassotalea sp. LPB0316]
MYDEPITCWEDLAIGQVYEYGAVSISESEIIEFAKAYDPMPFHICPEKAKQSPFGQLIASGLHTLSINQRMSFDHVFSQWAVIAGKEISHCQFLAPVFADDVLSAQLTITDLKTLGNNARGSVYFSIVTKNQLNQPVLSIRCEMILACKSRV